jgi:hypothetical protein
MLLIWDVKGSKTMPPNTPDAKIPSPIEEQLRRLERYYLRRLRLRGLLRLGLAFVVVAAFVLALWPWGGVLRYGSVGGGLATLFWLGWIWGIKPGRQRLDRRQLALLLDERLPELENLALSSVDFSRRDFKPASAWMVERVLHGVGIDLNLPPRRWEARLAPTRHLAWATAAVWGLALLGGGWGLYRLALDTWHAEGGVVSFVLRPGDTRLRHGDDLLVWVEEAQAGTGTALRWRSQTGQWRSVAMRPGGDGGTYFYELPDLYADTQYQVQVGDERSVVYTAAVWTPARVEGIELRYRYPDYLGLEPDTLADGGHIAGPAGSQVELVIGLNRAVLRAELVLRSGQIQVLRPVGEFAWQGVLELEEDDTYHVVLHSAESVADAGADGLGGVDGDADDQGVDDQSADGQAVGEKYSIRVQQDLAPRIRTKTPRGDDEATALEEVPFEFELEDEHGLVEYGLQYEVAGREKVRLKLSPAGLETAPVLKARGRYTLALETLGLMPGDVLTWSVWGRDQKPGRLEYEMLGDPYFLEIRPYRRFFAAAVSNSGNAESGAEGGSVDQKKVIIATWNLRREAVGLDESEFSRRRAAVSQAQQDVVTAVGQAQENSGGDAAQTLAAFERAALAALAALAQAVLPEPGAALSRALVEQQRAYAQLLRLEPRRRQVGQNAQSQGQGQGREQSAQRRELDGLETERRRDFAEEASTLQERLAATEQVRDGLEELARRQEAINHDLARLVSERESEQLSQEQEQQRRLQRLQEEQRRTLEELDALNGGLAAEAVDPGSRQQARQNLEEARRQMGRSAGNMEGESLQAAAAAGRRASEALQQADANLGSLSRQAAAERMQQLRRDFSELRLRQEKIAVQSRQRAGGPKSLDGEKGTLSQEKAELAAEYQRFMDEAGRVAEQASRTQELMARRLGDWLRRTNGAGIQQDMLQSGEYGRFGAWENAAEIETLVGTKLAAAASQLDSVAALAVGDETEAMERALGLLRQLVARGRAGGQEQRVAEGTAPQDSLLQERQSEGHLGNDPSQVSQAQGLSSQELNSDGLASQTPGAPSPNSPGPGRGEPIDGGESEGANGGRDTGGPGWGEWIEGVRSAEEFLPRGGPLRSRLGQIRRQLTAQRRRSDTLKPRYDLLLEQTIRPLEQVAEDLTQRLAGKGGEAGQRAAAEQVPARYRAAVAEYFKALAEWEAR